MFRVILQQPCGFDWAIKTEAGESFCTQRRRASGPNRIETWFQTRARAAQNIRYHYDRSNEFYKQLLDQRMVYSCAYFRTTGAPLDEAQVAKLEQICENSISDPVTGSLTLAVGGGRC